MDDLFKSLTDKLGNLVGKWTTYAAFGSFLLYLIGYLTLRFQLSTYGLATDLDLFDEKYFFAGCRFLVYLVSSVPSILVGVLVLGAIFYLLYRLTPDSYRGWAGRQVEQWCARPLRLQLLGIVVGVVFIQMVMRKCFAFGNILLRKDLPDEWITSILLTSDAKLALYFSGLVAGTLLTAFIAWQAAARTDSGNAAGRFLGGVLVFLVAVEVLLLPVNYGVLISTQQLPQVGDLPAGTGPGGQRAWLVWDTRDKLTYFLYGPQDRRMLLTVPRKDPTVRIVGYDDIYCVLFSADHSGPRPCPR